MSEEQPKAFLPRLLIRLRELWSRPKVRFGTTLFLVGALAGVVAVGTTAKMVKQTNTTEFCTGCHVYEEFAEEFKASTHHSNATGVSAECGDCHIPHDNWFNTLRAKASSGFADVFAYTVGGVNTPEEFEARRAVLARDVWQDYERLDSKYCRHCHETAAWDLAAQTQLAQRFHRGVLEGEGTCIDCHKGIVHSIPEGARVEESAQGMRAGGSGADTGGGAGGGSAGGGEGEPGPGQGTSTQPAAASSTSGSRDAGSGAGSGEESGDAARTAQDDSAGAALFEPCRECHGQNDYSPAPQALGALGLDQFLAKIDEHMYVGGEVSGLTDEERKTIYRYLESL